jgi:iron complex outermembrane recepter protein
MARGRESTLRRRFKFEAAIAVLLIPCWAVAQPEEVVVTGTHIRAAPVGVKLITITQEDILAGGFTRIEEALRVLPQNFGGGPREDTRPPPNMGDVTSGTNVAKGSTLNLRGLGGGATLVLVNGRRVSPSGSEALFTDISQLPLSAVERIEVLTDGASALYGSDAVGGVVNVILRRDYRGATTSVRLADGAGGTQDWQVSQLLGGAWQTGSANFSYEFVDRDALSATSQGFSANSDQRPRGGDNFSSTSANPGTIYVGTRTWAIPAGQDGHDLDPSTLVEGTVNYQNASEYLDLLPEQQRHSVAGFISQSLGSRFTLWAQGFATHREGQARYSFSDNLRVPSSNAFYVNPTGRRTDIVVRYDLTQDFGHFGSETEVKSYSATAGFDFKAGGNWTVTVDFSRGEERAEALNDGINRNALTAALADSNPDTAFNPFGDGPNTNPLTIDRLRERNFSGAESDLELTSLVAEGPIWQGPGGPVRLAVGVDYRQYAFAARTASGATEGDRDLDSAFAELRVPIFGAQNRRPLLQSFALSAAVRRERYSDFGRSVVPKFGVSWSPWQPLALRAAWSESFRAPDLTSLDESRNLFFVRSVPDPLAPAGTSTILQWSGGNAGLKPETAKNLSAGFDLDVPWVSDLRVGLTYFDIRYTNRLRSPLTGLTGLDELLGNPRYSPFVIRNPDSSFRQRVCASGTSADLNREACLNTPISAIVDMRTANTAKLNTDGVDLDLSYRRALASGQLRLGLLATRILSYEQATVETFPLVSQLNLKYLPVDTRLRANASWTRGDWSTTLFVNYVDDYSDVSAASVRKIGSWTTADLDIAYTHSQITLALNAQNVFDRDPPFANAAIGYDPTNANPYGRIVSALVRKQW